MRNFHLAPTPPGANGIRFLEILGFDVIEKPARLVASSDGAGHLGRRNANHDDRGVAVFGHVAAKKLDLLGVDHLVKVRHLRRAVGRIGHDARATDQAERVQRPVLLSGGHVGGYVPAHDDAPRLLAGGRLIVVAIVVWSREMPQQEYTLRFAQSQPIRFASEEVSQRRADSCVFLRGDGRQDLCARDSLASCGWNAKPLGQGQIGFIQLGIALGAQKIVVLLHESDKSLFGDVGGRGRLHRVGRCGIEPPGARRSTAQIRRLAASRLKQRRRRDRQFDFDRNSRLGNIINRTPVVCVA